MFWKTSLTSLKRSRERVFSTGLQAQAISGWRQNLAFPIDRSCQERKCTSPSKIISQQCAAKKRFWGVHARVSSQECVLCHCCFAHLNNTDTFWGQVLGVSGWQATYHEFWPNGWLKFGFVVFVAASCSNYISHAGSLGKSQAAAHLSFNHVLPEVSKHSFATTIYGAQLYCSTV